MGSRGGVGEKRFVVPLNITDALEFLFILRFWPTLASYANRTSEKIRDGGSVSSCTYNSTRGDGEESEVYRRRCPSQVDFITRLYIFLERAPSTLIVCFLGPPTDLLLCVSKGFAARALILIIAGQFLLLACMVKETLH